jgi:hypothetical protein
MTMDLFTFVFAFLRRSAVRDLLTFSLGAVGLADAVHTCRPAVRDVAVQ